MIFGEFLGEFLLLIAAGYSALAADGVLMYAYGMNEIYQNASATTSQISNDLYAQILALGRTAAVEGLSGPIRLDQNGERIAAAHARPRFPSRSSPPHPRPDRAPPLNPPIHPHASVHPLSLHSATPCPSLLRRPTR